MRRRDVTQAIVMLAVRVHITASIWMAVCLIDALKVGGAVRSWALIDALIIRAALWPRHLLVTNLETNIDISEITNQKSSIWIKLRARSIL